MSNLFTGKDLEFLNKKGISPKIVEQHIEIFKKGINFLPIKAHASINNGIVKLSNDEIEELKNFYDQESENISIVKFVPASGAATRMFKILFEYIHADTNVIPESLIPFFDGLTRFAFYKELNGACKKLYGLNIEKLISGNRQKDIVKALLEKSGLGYGSSPKALLAFHIYDENPRTALEEHLVEGALYATSKNKKVKIHFTVSPEHQKAFEERINKVLNKYSKEFNVTYKISYSAQKPHTDTVAVDLNNNPFYSGDGTILFRPGGHGALLDNLNEIGADIVFIKNIDNVVPDKLKGETIIYKKALAGKLLELQKSLFEFSKIIDQNDSVSGELLNKIERFYQENLFFQFPDEYTVWDKAKRIDYLKTKINRPIRVCGMVKNEGEPGGGPFLAFNRDGSVSLQVVETSQIDKGSNEQSKHLDSSTHFNPVDLICTTKNHKDEKYNLFDFRDPETGFISTKSSEGRDLKALELPGLWNGAMSDWNTLFVEVPIITFNPVKTILDLLRKEHQN